MAIEPEFSSSQVMPTNERIANLKVKPLQERRASPRFPFQTPISRDCSDKVRLLPDLGLGDVRQNALDDDIWDKRRPVPS